MAVTVNPETNPSARNCGTACALISPECGLPTVTSQSQPATAGSPMTWDRLEPNTSAARTAASAAAIPTIAGRTGTAARPRPGSNASRIPDTAAGDSPQPASRPASRTPGRTGAVPRALARTARGADSAARPASSSASTAAPPSRAAASNANPGEISARRASPIGVSTDSA